jgi:uncharacterized protein
MLFIICLTAFIAATLTFFSGFGLGTLLSPVFMLFFPVDVSIALTGIVHFFNNIFKLVLTGRQADRAVLIRFGLPSVIFAFIGARLLLRLSDLEPMYSLHFLDAIHPVSPMKFTAGLLLFFFSAMELVPFLERIRFDKDKLVLGGVLSGFFGGLTGNQGALRSAFLVNAGLTKEAFIGTAVVVSCLVDFTRLGVYAAGFTHTGLAVHWQLLVAASLSAMTGAFLGNKLFKKTTLGFIRTFVAIFLALIAAGLLTGLV